MTIQRGAGTGRSTTTSSRTVDGSAARIGTGIAGDRGTRTRVAPAHPGPRRSQRLSPAGARRVEIPARSEAMSIDANKQLVRRFIDDVFVAGGDEAVDELLAPDFVGHTWGPQP